MEKAMNVGTDGIEMSNKMIHTMEMSIFTVFTYASLSLA